jgi:hypothetical protein
MNISACRSRINIVDFSSMTVLILCVIKDDISIIKILLKSSIVDYNY